MDIIEHYRVYFFNKVAFFMQFSAPIEAHMAKKNTEMCLYGDEMFLSTILLKLPSPIKGVLNINFDTSDVPMQHLCITAPKYGGLYRTFYDIRNTQFLSSFLVIRVQK